VPTRRFGGRRAEAYRGVESCCKVTSPSSGSRERHPSRFLARIVHHHTLARDPTTHILTRRLRLQPRITTAFGFGRKVQRQALQVRSQRRYRHRVQPRIRHGNLSKWQGRPTRPLAIHAMPLSHPHHQSEHVNASSNPKLEYGAPGTVLAS
jgi:hypothetical protein